MAGHELVLRGGRVVDPGRGTDEVTDVAFARGVVAGSGPALDGERVLDARGCVVMPGMIDFHAHLYWGGTALGVDPDALARRAGTTTWLDVGSAGAGNFEGLRRHVVERSETRVLAYLHVSFAGIFGFSREVMVGESWDLRLLEPAVCARLAREHPDLIRGIKVRIGANTSGAHGLTPLHLAIEAAEEAGLPVMCHIDRPPPRYEEVLAALRPGDVLTHCFRPFPNAPVRAGGEVREACRQAREHGVLFDIGHGMGSFSFRVAEAMLAGGFPPDVISSDVHALCVDGPAFDNLVTMSKLLCLGMPLPEVVRAASATPARLLGRPDLADLGPGSTGDATVLRVEEGRFAYTDATGAVMTGDRRLALHAVVLGGRLWHEALPEAASVAAG
ncbi:MAG TPA: amidohydrolase/deacetylase family metallohydrolase [Geminicoccaceae bacterium]